MKYTIIGIYAYADYENWESSLCSNVVGTVEDLKEAKELVIQDAKEILQYDFFYHCDPDEDLESAADFFDIDVDEGEEISEAKENKIRKAFDKRLTDEVKDCLEFKKKIGKDHIFAEGDYCDESTEHFIYLAVQAN